jgi:hypothetical protein
MPADRAASILARFNAAHNFLVSRLRELPPRLAERSGENDWSAAQVCCHVAMANDWTADVLLGTTPAAHGVGEELCDELDLRSVAWNAKTFPLDPPDVISCDHAVERLRSSAHHLSKAIASLTTERGTRYAVTLPIGTLSLFQLAEYTVAHVARHSAQLGQSGEKSY